MITYPRLKTFLSVFPLSESSWGVRGGGDEVWRVRLNDPRSIAAFGAMLPYLNGRTATEDILDELERQGHQRAVAAAVLRQMTASSLIEDADTHGLPETELARFEHQIRYLSRFTNQGGAKLQSMLRRSRIGLLADDALGESLYGRLSGAGVGEVVVLSRDAGQAARWIERVPPPRPATVVLEADAEHIWPARAGEQPQLLIVGQDAHEPQLLEAVDALSKRRELPWLLVRNLDLREAWVGPLFVPGETSSFLSLEARLRTNMPGFPEYVAFDAHVRNGARPPPTGALNAALDLVASIAAIEAIKFITEFRVPELLGRFLTINLWTWDAELHDVLRIPALDRPETSRLPVFPWKVIDNGHGASRSDRA